jgi:predicted secreted protein with PEFG-CTERM motif
MAKTLAPVVLLTLMIAQFVSIVPIAEAGRPRDLGMVYGTLSPGAVTDPPLVWRLNQDIADFVIYYNITGGVGPDDVASATIENSGIPSWESWKGEGWEYCECAMDAGSYNVTVGADPSATAPLSFKIGFYVVAQPPVDFSGHIPDDSNVRYSDFGVQVPAGNHTLTLGVSSGTYEFFVNDESQGVVTKTTQLTLDFEAGLYIFRVNATTQGLAEDVRWFVQIQGPPKLEVKIVNYCVGLNPDIGQSSCVTGAEATASDGSQPSISYLWSATGGTFNSTSSQWVKWTAPPGAAGYTLTVNVSAPGYLSDTDSLSVQVAPEFPSAALPFLIAAVLAIVLLARRSQRHAPA